MNGNVEQIWAEQRKVKINGEWFGLAQHVNLEYVKQGPVSFSVDQANTKLITFIKSTGNAPQQQRGGYPSRGQSQYPSKPQQSFPKRNESEILAQFCTREALQAISIYNSIATPEKKILPTMNNIRENAKIIWSVVKSLPGLMEAPPTPQPTSANEDSNFPVERPGEFPGDMPDY